jgi:signal transduction histidine kinase
MWKKALNYFLERFRQKSKTEIQKAYYLLLSTLTVLGFFLFLSIAHLIVWPLPIYLISDLLGVIGCLVALYKFRKGSVETAGRVLIGFVILVFSVHCIVGDFFHNDPAMRYRIYVTLACIYGTFFIFISFFRSIRQLIYFTVGFIIILTVHFGVIVHQIGSDREMAIFAFEHYGTAVAGVLAAALISGLLITLIETLYTQAIQQGEVILRQNDELQQTVDEQTRFLVSSNESLKEFAYLTSHDLREPLRNISGFITLIKKNCDNASLDEDKKKDIGEYFEYIQKGVQQMEELIKDIKEYSAINVLEKNFAPIAMGDLIRQAGDTLSADITKTNASVRIQPDIPTVMGDNTLLYSLMLNLISNAIKYHRSGVPPEIDISYQHTSEGHVFAVRDNGIGIPAQYSDRIFHAFKRLHGPQDKYSGTGLGLAICKKTVEIHGGKIWFESQPGRGTTFYFTLKDGQ